MKNLFDFATKELSQDAFLSWFIANCNDLVIGAYAYDFIRFLTGFNIKNGDIENNIEIKQQEKNMDIVVDFWANGQHYVIVVEDKTYSSLHNQLEKYNKEINSWNQKEEGHEERTKRIFYKIDEFSKADRSELDRAKKAVGDTAGVWEEFDLERIHGFFKSVNNTGSQILDLYADHIRDVYKRTNEVSSENPKQWDNLDTKTFFRKAIIPFSIENGLFKKENIHEYFYQGRYYAIQFKTLLKNTKSEVIVWPQVEIIVRPKDSPIKIYTHFAVPCDEEGKMTWKYSECLDKEGKYRQIFNIAVDVFKGHHLKIQNPFAKTNQTISIEGMNKNPDMENNVMAILKKYKDIFEEIDNRVGNV